MATEHRRDDGGKEIDPQQQRDAPRQGEASIEIARDGERQHKSGCSGEPLQKAQDGEHGDVRGDYTQQRSEREDRDADEERLPAPTRVAERSDDHLTERQAEDTGGQGHLRQHRRGAEILAYRGERG